jgi:hypothetical protein
MTNFSAFLHKWTDTVVLCRFRNAEEWRFGAEAWEKKVNVRTANTYFWTTLIRPRQSDIKVCPRDRPLSPSSTWDPIHLSHGGCRPSSLWLGLWSRSSRRMANVFLRCPSFFNVKCPAQTATLRWWCSEYPLFSESVRFCPLRSCFWNGLDLS